MRFQTVVQTQTSKKGNTETTIKTTLHFGMVEFDVLVLSSKVYDKLVGQAILKGKHTVDELVGCKVTRGADLLENEIVLLKGDRLVGMLYDYEEDNALRHFAD